MIKTFERKRELFRLIRSIRIYYPSVSIVVVDDSKTPVTIPGINVVKLDYDSGVGVGRTEGIKRVHTPFFLHLDDDFVLYQRSNILEALEKMINNPHVDIIGGYLINLPFLRKSGPGGRIGISKQERKIALKTEVAGLLVYDKVPQFYIGRTRTVKECGWDVAIKRLDHGVFFGRAKGSLVTLFDPSMSILHARTPFNSAYMSKRYDFSEDVRILQRRYQMREMERSTAPSEQYQL